MEIILPSAATACRAAPCNHLSRRREKKQTSRRNLGVKWVVGDAPAAAIAFVWKRLSGHPVLEAIRETLSQHRWRVQLPLEADVHGSAERVRHARVEPREPADTWYRGTLGRSARVYGPGGGRVRPCRRVATRVSIVSGVEKKYDKVWNGH